MFAFTTDISNAFIIDPVDGFSDLYTSPGTNNDLTHNHTVVIFTASNHQELRFTISLPVHTVKSKKLVPVELNTPVNHNAGRCILVCNTTHIFCPYNGLASTKFHIHVLLNDPV
jgi:hypothetical protein